MTPEEKARDRYLRTKYGIGLDDYIAILVFQNGRCAICGRLPGQRAFHVDHDHKANRVRGLLCWLCNHDIIGRQTDPEIFRAAARYLEHPPADEALLST